MPTFTSDSDLTRDIWETQHACKKRAKIITTWHFNYLVNIRSLAYQRSKMNTTLLVSKRSELVRLNPAFNLLRCYLCAEPIPQPPSPPQEDESNITQAVQLLLEIPHQEWSSSKPLQSLFFSPPPPPPPPSPCFLFKITRSLPSYCQAFNFFNHLQKSFPFEDTHFLSYPFQVLEQAGRERNAGSWLFELIKLPNMGNSFDCLRRRASYSVFREILNCG